MAILALCLKLRTMTLVYDLLTHDLYDNQQADQKDQQYHYQGVLLLFIT